MAKIMDMSGTVLNLLGFVSLREGRQWHVRGLARETGISHGAASSGLRALAQMGFIRSEKRGNLLLYSVVEDNPALRHFKIFCTLFELNPLVIGLKAVSERVILFGSAAEGTETDQSDIDVLVVTFDKRPVEKKLAGATVKGLRLNAVLMTPEELLRASRNDKPFHDRAVDGIVVWRTADE